MVSTCSSCGSTIPDGYTVCINGVCPSSPWAVDTSIYRWPSPTYFTPRTEKLVGKLLNPQTLLEHLAVAVLEGDEAAMMALVDKIKEELG